VAATTVAVLSRFFPEPRLAFRDSEREGTAAAGKAPPPCTDDDEDNNDAFMCCRTLGMIAGAAGCDAPAGWKEVSLVALAVTPRPDCSCSAWSVAPSILQLQHRQDACRKKQTRAARKRSTRGETLGPESQTRRGGEASAQNRSLSKRPRQFATTRGIARPPYQQGRSYLFGSGRHCFWTRRW
jgi:hypothetical protein